MNLLLVTQGFPYGESEQGFLPVEYGALSENFSLTVMAFDLHQPLKHTVRENVRHCLYSWPEKVRPWELVKQLRYPEVRKDLALALRKEKRLFPKRALRIFLYSLRAEQTLPKLRAIVEENQIEMVYTYWCVQATIAALRLGEEKPSLRVITRFHGMDLYPEQTAENWEPLRPYVAQGCQRLLFVSDLGKKFFLEQYGWRWAAKSMTCYVGCRPLAGRNAADKADKTLVLISCAALIPMKRVSLIVKGLAALPETVSVQWHHFGDGPERKALEGQATARLANQPQINYTFHGFVANEAMHETMLSLGAQLFITTSETEGLPVSVMEAFAMGIPAVATAVGGIPEMLREGENGFLLSPNPSPQEVAQSLLRFMNLSQEARERMGQQALEVWRQKFNAEENTAKLIDELRSMRPEGG